MSDGVVVERRASTRDGKWVDLVLRHLPEEGEYQECWELTVRGVPDSKLEIGVGDPILQRYFTNKDYAEEAYYEGDFQLKRIDLDEVGDRFMSLVTSEIGEEPNMAKKNGKKAAAVVTKGGAAAAKPTAAKPAKAAAAKPAKAVAQTAPKEPKEKLTGPRGVRYGAAATARLIQLERNNAPVGLSEIVKLTAEALGTPEGQIGDAVRASILVDEKKDRCTWHRVERGVYILNKNGLERAKKDKETRDNPPAEGASAA